MTNAWALQQSAEMAAANLVACNRLGLTDADATAATIALLITAIQARQALSPNRVPFDALIKSIKQLQAEGTITDTLQSAILTVAANPFVAAVATDLLSLLGTNLPSGYDPFSQAQCVIFPAMAPAA